MQMEWRNKTLPGIDFPIVDAHAHPYFNRDCPGAGPVDFDQYRQELEQAGISVFCGSCNIRNDGTDADIIRQENEHVLQWRQHFGSHFYPGCNIHPNFPDASMDAIRQFHELGFRWLGEIAGYVQGYSEYATPEMLRILELAGELGMVLNIHPSTYEDVDRLLAAMPDLKVVIAHPGLWGCDASYALGEKHPNAYFDLSGTGLFRWHMLRWGIDRLGMGRILFGTDYPLVNPAMYVQGVLAEPLTYEERKAVFYGNFARLTNVLMRGSQPRR